MEYIVSVKLLLLYIYMPLQLYKQKRHSGTSTHAEYCKWYSEAKQLGPKWRSDWFHAGPSGWTVAHYTQSQVN